MSKKNSDLKHNQAIQKETTKKSELTSAQSNLRTCKTNFETANKNLEVKFNFLVIILVFYIKNFKLKSKVKKMSKIKRNKLIKNKKV
jgi:hypothetical protein